MATEEELQKSIRKLRKKLRQIENLERLDRVLSSEEQYKVSKKSDIRSKLLDFLSSCSPGDSTSCMTTALSGQAIELTDLSLDSQELGWSDEEHEDGDEEYDDEDDIHDTEVEPQQTKKMTEHAPECITDEEKAKRRRLDVSPSVPMPEKMAGDAQNIHTSYAHKTPAVCANTSQPAQESFPSKKQTHKVKKTSTNTVTQSDTVPDSSRGSKPAPNPLKQIHKHWTQSQWSVDRLYGHNDLVCSVSVCGRWLLTGSRDTTAKLWDTVSGQETRSFGGHTGTVTCVQLLDETCSRGVVEALSLKSNSPETPSIGLSGSVDCSIKIWDLHSGQMLKSIYTYSPVTRLVYSSTDGTGLLLSASDGGKIEIWDLENGIPTQSLRAHDNSVTGLKVCFPYVYSTASDGILKVHQIRNGSLYPVFVSENIKITSGASLLQRHIRCLATAHHILYYGDDAMNIKAVDWKEGVAHKLANHTNEFGTTDALCTSSDLDLLISSGYDLDNGLGFINVRHLPDEKYLCSLCDEETSCIVALDCCHSYPHNDGVTIVTGGMELMLWKQITKETKSAVNTENRIQAQYVPHFSRPPHHSDIDSESEPEVSFEDEEDLSQADDFEDSHISPPFNPRPKEEDHRGWFSWCTIV